MLRWDVREVYFFDTAAGDDDYRNEINDEDGFFHH
jgi:hypothetical protein